MDLKLNTRNKRMLAVEKTNGPYVWLRQASKSHHQASFVNKILRNLAWEFIYAKVTTLLFENEAWCLCSSDESVHKGYLTRENKIDQVRTVSWCDFKGLTWFRQNLLISSSLEKSKRDSARQVRVMYDSIYLFIFWACMFTIFFCQALFFSLNVAIMWPLKTLHRTMGDQTLRFWH